MIELVVFHDGKNWIAQNGDISFYAYTLEELDDAIRKQIQTGQTDFRCEPIKVMMRFDNATIPGWIRQYMPHYFNRVIIVEPLTINKGDWHGDG